MKSKEFIKTKKNQFLVFLSILHTVIGFTVMTCILSFSFNKHLPLVDLISSFVPLSFVIFRRCIHLDFFSYIKGNECLPEYTEDGYFFNKLQKMLFKKEIMSKKELNEYKGGDVKDVLPFCSLEDKKTIQNIFNEKTHYITINSLVIVILLTKYKLRQFIPFYLGWFFYNFTD